MAALTISFAAAASAISGCVPTKTVLVKPGDPVRIREDTPANVWTRDASGTWVESRVTIPAGWYALPDPGEKAPPAATAATGSTAIPPVNEWPGGVFEGYTLPAPMTRDFTEGR